MYTRRFERKTLDLNCKLNDFLRKKSLALNLLNFLPNGFTFREVKALLAFKMFE